MKKLLLFTGMISIFLLVNVSCNRDEMDESFELSKSFEANKQNNSKYTGFNEFGYNWQAHHFNGVVMNAIFGDYIDENGNPAMGLDPYNGDDEAYLAKYPWLALEEYQMLWSFRNIHLVMHWSKTLISDFGVYPDNWFNSGSWITFHYSGINNHKNWSQFQKLVAARSSDELINGIWYDRNGNELGYASDWPDLIIVQINTTGEPPFPFTSDSYKNSTSPGLGNHKMKN
ncbi:hypothetical protein [Namhaeicola litoreus]|uniref:Uncharacterized protein n=1 Tax=Namhaeicola litoreus TaxID=1052145 RepID=A0ABW3Y825_9FLAO